MNHARFPKEDHLPDWACRDSKVTKGDRVDYVTTKLANAVFYQLPFHIWTLAISANTYNYKSLIIKPTRCTNFSIYFWNKTLHVSDSSSVHHQEFFTVNTAMVCVVQVCWQLASRILTLLVSCQQTCMTYTIAVRTVKNSWCWTEELSETRRVLFQK